jgi:anti-anti-sigma regulatory factor
MGQFLLEDSDRGKILRVEGSLTIEHACSLKEILIEALEKTEHLDIDLQNITSVDLACLQIFCAAHTNFVEDHKHMGMLGDPPEIFKKSLFNTGIDRSACETSRDSECL